MVGLASCTSTVQFEHQLLASSGSWPGCTSFLYSPYRAVTIMGSSAFTVVPSSSLGSLISPKPASDNTAWMRSRSTLNDSFVPGWTDSWGDPDASPGLGGRRT